MKTSDHEAGAILADCQQTRFHLLGEDSANKDIDIKGLNIAIASDRDLSTAGRKDKAKSKAKADRLEILNDAELRLRSGVHYALVGRNGTGKSTLLRAIADKLIPGIALSMKIAILQQTDSDPGDGATEDSPKPVLEYVVEGDPHRNQIVKKVDMLAKALDSGDSIEPVRAWRKLHFEEMQQHLAEAQKMARLRSGARGKDAREYLLAYEQKVEEYEAKVNQADTEISAEALEEDTTAAAELLANLQTELDSVPAAELEAKSRQILAGLGFKGAQLSAPFSSLSGGWKMRCKLATTLAQSSDVLILDEPTNYLDLLGILWLQQHLDSLTETMPDRILVLVSHDRDFVNAVSSDTIILQEQKLVYFNGNVASYDKSIRHEILYKSRMKEAQDKQVAHMEKTVANNMRQGKKTGDENKIRQAKSRQKKLEERTGLEVSAKGTRFKLNRDLGGYHLTNRAAIEIPKEERGVSMSFPDAPDLRFPGSLVSLEKVSFAYSRKSAPVLQDIDFVVHGGDKIGILGLNGAGKSTLVRLLVDEAKPSAGTATRHPRVKIAHYSQHAVEQLKVLLVPASAENPTGMSNALFALLHHASELGEDMSEQDARSLLGSLGLPGRTATDVPISKLSGGQLVRLELCRLLLGRPHLFVLDEPTTHLDLPTVKALTRALIDWNGAIILVSHDRYLIRCVVEGEPVEEKGSDDEDDDENDDQDEAQKGGLARRRIVYQIKAGKMAQVAGVGTWEGQLERRLKKLGL